MSKKKKEIERKKEKEIELQIYCGPNLNGELQQFTVFKNGIPGYLSKHIKECPEIENMIIPIGRLKKVRNKLNQQGSRENELYNKILKYRKEA